MSKEELNTMDEPIVNETVEVTYAPDEIVAKIVKEDDGYHVVDHDGTIGEVCKIVDDGKTIALTKNASNRKWYNIAKAEAEIEANGYCGLTYKASKTLGPVGSRSTVIPNAKLIAYLPQELQDEYKAIIDRAKAARDADKKKPMTEKEKLQAKIAKAQAALAALEAEAAN